MTSTTRSSTKELSATDDKKVGGSGGSRERSKPKPEPILYLISVRFSANQNTFILPTFFYVGECVGSSESLTARQGSRVDLRFGDGRTLSLSSRVDKIPIQELISPTSPMSDLDHMSELARVLDWNMEFLARGHWIYG
ncbi:hypothetical protein VKT23_012854 [Stygiomarasmius scandens]|uniref:Uncharacterized protein n=1 Tax=Marasmiellus scandens TaxID=2682957 RepID=A0ABR1J4K2_9AGAR